MYLLCIGCRFFTSLNTLQRSYSKAHRNSESVASICISNLTGIFKSWEFGTRLLWTSWVLSSPHFSPLMWGSIFRGNKETEMEVSWMQDSRRCHIHRQTNDNLTFLLRSLNLSSVCVGRMQKRTWQKNLAQGITMLLKAMVQCWQWITGEGNDFVRHTAMAEDLVRQLCKLHSIKEVDT